MICPECKKRMTCVDSYTEINDDDPRTARRHVCSSCGYELYTMEQEYNINDVTAMLKNRHNHYNKYKRVIA